MLRFVPPAGTPLPLPKLLAACGAALSANGNREEWLRSFAAFVGAPRAFAVDSGRTALWLILRALHSLRPARNVVVIPGYTCFSVPASIARAGLRILPVDVDPDTLDFDFAALEKVSGENLLAIVNGNLFGLVNDNTRIRQIADARGAFFVDDAAQSLGAVRDGIRSGAAGDAGLFSLSRGKALAAGEGGIIIAASAEIAGAIEDQIANLPEPSSKHRASLWAKTFAISLLLNPRFYWLPQSLPFLKLGVTEFNPHFPVARMAGLPQALVLPLLERLEDLQKVRNANASALRMSLEGTCFPSTAPATGSTAAYIRFPVLAPDQETRAAVLRRFREAGIGASPYYPHAVCDVPGVHTHLADQAHLPAAEDVARRIFALPTHPFVRSEDLRRIGEILRSV